MTLSLSKKNLETKYLVEHHIYYPQNHISFSNLVKARTRFENTLKLIETMRPLYCILLIILLFIYYIIKGLKHEMEIFRVHTLVGLRITY